MTIGRALKIERTFQKQAVGELGCAFWGVMKPVPSSQGTSTKSTLLIPALEVELNVLAISLSAKQIGCVFQIGQVCNPTAYCSSFSLLYSFPSLYFPFPFSSLPLLPSLLAPYSSPSPRFLCFLPTQQKVEGSVPTGDLPTIGTPSRRVREAP